ncbi:MAG: glycine--tRNA ligase subunit beta, partial [Sphingobium sp.]|nr:glycine--tRNA ligase subunit beta [Sphingobium sp.]
VGQGDDVPTDPVTVAVSLADKLDTLVCFFAIDERPTGSRDPFALRRSALGELALTLTNNLRCSKISVLRTVVSNAPIFGPDSDSFAAFERIYGHGFAGDESADEAEAEDRRRIEAIADQVIEFLIDRLKVQQREAGVRHDLIDAVFALGGEDDLVRLLARVRALQSFITTEDGANLLAGYRRAANILKKEAVGDGVARAPAYTPEPAEAALIAALDRAEPAADTAIAREDFEAAMAALAQLRAPIDAFFESVTVNDADPAKRAARLALLMRVRDAVHRVADFSRIEG